MKEEKNKRHTRRVRNLVVLFVLLAVFLAVATYAWFIGMRTVNVSAFDVKIAAIDGLKLSIDGETWLEELDINSTNFMSPIDDPEGEAYEGNTNKWAGRGLIPMSTVGAMDTTASRLQIFEKASLSATPGGYRLLASRVDNYTVPTDEEPDGYVVFDLFIKNLSGTEYYGAPSDEDNEEAIYLTVDSQAIVRDASDDPEGYGVKDTGIENSVRVGFAQIGRVIGTETDAGIITGITCTTAATVTGICRTAQIWEPNDTHHTQNAIRWYNASCKNRTGDATSFVYGASPCSTITDGLFYRTYAVNDKIDAEHVVDVYDGDSLTSVYNGYASSKLTGIGTFTDTHKNMRGTNRPAFMTLAPNSITKVRVYIWIEGQDTDNYDFAAIGKFITINFGFTKERYTEEDIDYDGPLLNQGYGPDGVPLTPPVITISYDGNDLDIEEEVTVSLGTTTWEDDMSLGVSATTLLPDGNSTALPSTAITRTGTVDATVAGTYRYTYRAEDTYGNIATKVLIVKVS